MMTQERIDYFLNTSYDSLKEGEFSELVVDFCSVYAENYIDNDFYDETYQKIRKKHLIPHYNSFYLSKSRLDYFLSTNYENLKEGEYSELLDGFFRRFKKKSTDEDIKLYWELLRKHVMTHSKHEKIYQFKGFKFPKFLDYSFWEADDKKEFEFDVIILSSTFYDKVSFYEVEFTGNVLFDEVKFTESTNFNRVLFENRLEFKRVEFKNDVYFFLSELKNFTKFEEVIFNTQVNFTNIYFDDLEFSAVHFKKGIFESVHWNKVKFSKLNPKRKFELPFITFDSIYFSKNSELCDFDISELAFINCDLTHILFNRCEWNNATKKNRLFFRSENSKHIHTEEVFKDSENHYRQLKQNFTSIGNWELAGYAYVSEMEMRKKRLWKDKKFLTWFFYAFYKYLGGYTQDFIRPVVALLGSFVFFSGIYFLIDFEYQNAFQRSISATLPYIQVQDHIVFPDYWLIARNIQFILSVTLLSFFVLALRKRFKL